VATRTLTHSITGSNIMEGPGFGGFVLKHVWGSTPPVIDVYGQWPSGEFTQHHYQDSTLLVIGYCLLSPARQAAEFIATVDTSTSAMDDNVSVIADWPGAYSAVLLHRGSIAAYADLSGQFPLYYSRRDCEILVGSEPRALAARHERGYDPVTIAAHIACAAVLPLWWGRSPYSGIARLEGGGVLRAEAPHSVNVDWDRRPLPVPGRTMSEGASSLRTALLNAVLARCKDQAGSVVSSDFSGGLDSTSIAFLAAGASGRPVSSVCYHQPLAPAADLANAIGLARHESGVRLLVATGSKETLPFSALPDGSRGKQQGEPAAQALSSRAASVRLAVAASSGARLHLTGEGGDAVLAAAPSYLCALARTRDVPTLLRHCREYARLRYASSTAIAGKALRLARTRPARALALLARELEQPTGRPAGWASQVAWWPPSGEAATWLTPRIRRELAGVAGDPGTVRDIPDGTGAADLAALADLRRSGDASRYLRQLGASLRLAVHAPFLDADVIRAGLGVPAQNRADPWVYKPLLRAAMAGLVPANVFSRQTKGDYSAEDYRGARESAGALRALLRESCLADMGVLEPGALDDVLDRMIAGVSVPLGQVNMVLATETWLRAEAKVGMPVTCSAFR